MRTKLTRILWVANVVALGSIVLGSAMADAADGKPCKPSAAATGIALLSAAEHSDFGAFRTALDQGADVNARDTECNTPLIWAARSNNRAIAGELLALDVNFAAKNSLGKTALDYATDRDTEMKTQIDTALKAFDTATGQLINTGKLDDVVAIYDRRSLDPDYELANFEQQAPSSMYYGRRTAVMLATVAAPPGTDVVAFIGKMGERGAALDGRWDSLAEVAIDARRLDVLRFALAHGDGATAELAEKAARVGTPDFALSAIKLLITARDPSKPLAPWIEATALVGDPEKGVEALRMLVKDRDVLTDVGSALMEASGAELRFLLAHGAAIPKDYPLIARIVGVGEYGTVRSARVDLDLLELTLDRGARADVQTNAYGPQPDIIAVLLDNLFARENAAAAIGAAQFRRVLENLVKSGASFTTHDYNKNWPEPVDQVLMAGTHTDILPDVLATLNEMGGTAPRLCNYIGQRDLAIVVRLMSFKSSSESEGEAYDCTAKIGREQAGTPKDRQDLYQALADHHIAGREAALQNELSRVDNGGGDPRSVAALVIPGDQSCSSNANLANRIASALNRPEPCQ
ncbi:ankyrin repeat domain-containing protein [Rhizobium leguminosarum]|uniref:ankyrin repeat domain-containing protein n=1 Tax=Rhizobium ruizarguesonis TaxID=2081791 RepID=UPI001A9826C0|nr:ankyrin repeat domain-containing protein [Rhizobium ruizarguesonis]MBY5884584.1 ankyrin repeat domain-containing protein [Rhizobium leguminosarum]QSZ05149.1 ankyrin repeat domain-containing protein [Rhizobium ruizarguesonis]